MGTSEQNALSTQSMAEHAVKFPVELEPAFKVYYIIARALYGLSLVACICSAGEQLEDWKLGRQTIKRRRRENRSNQVTDDPTAFGPAEGSSSIIMRLLFFQKRYFCSLLFHIWPRHFAHAKGLATHGNAASMGSHGKSNHLHRSRIHSSSLFLCYSLL